MEVGGEDLERRNDFRWKFVSLGEDGVKLKVEFD